MPAQRVLAEPDGGAGWLTFTGRIGAVAVLGAGIGWVLSLDLDWSAAAGRRECTGQSGLCFGVALPVGVVAGMAAVAAACWIGFAVASVRPLYVTVPAGIVAVMLSLLVYLRTVPGGRLHPGWLFALVNAIVLAALAAPFLFLKHHPQRVASG